jgi:hypothetical protein
MTARTSSTAEASRAPDSAGVPIDAFLWPGYGENSRVLAWVFRRCDGSARAGETPIGRVPDPADIDTTGLKLDPTMLQQALRVDGEELRAELPQIREHLARFGTRLPDELRAQLDHLEQLDGCATLACGALALRIGRRARAGKPSPPERTAPTATAQPAALIHKRSSHMRSSRSPDRRRPHQRSAASHRRPRRA